MGENLTVRKRFSGDSEGVTSMEQEEFSFLWTVKNYSVVSRLEVVKSPTFYGGPKFNHAWRLSMKPKVKGVRNVEHLSLFLELVEYAYGEGHYSIEEGVTAVFKMALVNADGVESETRRGQSEVLEFNLSTLATSWGYRSLIAVTDLINPERKLVVDDSLKILIKIKIYDKLKKANVRQGDTVKRSPSGRKEIPTFEDNLAKDIGKLFRNSDGADLTIETDDQRVLKAHKAILMGTDVLNSMYYDDVFIILPAQSPVFTEMFNEDVSEKPVIITDFDGEVVEGMLEHLYTGETKRMEERSQELLKIAEKYDLEGLKEDCEFVIADSLNDENAILILVLAHTHNAPYLKERAMDYINLNKAKLMKSESFQNVMKSQVSSDLFADLYFSQLNVAGDKLTHYHQHYLLRIYR